MRVREPIPHVMQHDRDEEKFSQFQPFDFNHVFGQEKDPKKDQNMHQLMEEKLPHLIQVSEQRNRGKRNIQYERLANIGNAAAEQKKENNHLNENKCLNRNVKHPVAQK